MSVKTINGISETFQYGDQEVTLETGRVARQASGSVMVKTSGGAAILVTAVGVPDKSDEYSGFVPLTVVYQERSYAVGKIPGGFFRREGRPTTRETLNSRLIDRVLRPSFPKGFKSEVQVIATVLSLDEDSSPAILSIIGASAALMLSGIPFNGPVAAARVGYKDGQYTLNPNSAYLKDSNLDLVVGGNEQSVLMVESQANELSEAVMLEAVIYGHSQMQAAITAMNNLVKKEGASKPAWEWTPVSIHSDVEQKVRSIAEAEIISAYALTEKAARQAQLSHITEQTVATLCTGEEGTPSESEVKTIISMIEKNHVRQQLLEGKPRIDGRDTKTVRPITIDLGLLQRAHGSALFTRGETQACVSVTLGTGRDAQIVDDLSAETKNTFMLHYNFPPYSVGEVGFTGGPKRREIGHGMLAKRALLALLPSEEAFPYVLRVVSEITESNGSSSMATVCGASLALMQAGVPLRSAVAGIAMGLVKEEDGRSVILTDILGDEDHLGDMDFKVAGTLKGITALQMDIKINGIDRDIMAKALEQAKEGRCHILGIMNEVLDKPSEQLSQYAPRFVEFKIQTDKIRDVIGKGGVTIREITEKTGVTIDISDDGFVKIAAVEQASADAARQLIEDIVRDIEVGKIYEGKVVKLLDFGAFVSLLPNKDGFLHISEICQEHVHNIKDKLSEGQCVQVKVVDIDRQKNRVRLTMKNLKEMPEGA